MKTSNKIIAVILALIVIAGILWLYPLKKTVVNERVSGVPEEAYEATLIGVSTCLPHRDQSGPQTLECAFGIKTDEGDYYGLDMSDIVGDYQSYEGYISVHGILTPIENLSSDVWQKYDVKGIMKVNLADKL